jgi:MSHA biogenesis protein MshO
MRGANQQGFNLVELVIVILVLGIIVVAIAPVLSNPFTAYDDLSRRTALVDAAQSALSQIADDVRDSIPNTLRSNGTNAIEFMPIQLGGRYRYAPLASDVTGLTPSAPDASFQVLGNINALPASGRLVVFNTGANQFYNAATTGSGGIISPASTTLTLVDNGTEDQINLSSAYQFDLSGNGSPARRFYIATSPVSYVCDLANNQLLRYEGYAVSLGQPTNPSAAPLNTAPSQAVVAEYVTACDFDYFAGSNTRSGLLVMALTLTLQGESINLLHQMHVSNVP